MNKPAITVVVPVYNVEAYLRHCLNSIEEQTFQDFEVILINDGSTDAACLFCRNMQNGINALH